MEIMGDWTYWENNDYLVALKGHEPWRLRIFGANNAVYIQWHVSLFRFSYLSKGGNGIYLGYSVFAVLHIEVVGIDRGLVEVAHMENNIYFKKNIWQGL